MEDFIIILLQSLATTAWLVMLGRVLFSWIDPQFERPLGQFLFSLGGSLGRAFFLFRLFLVGPGEPELLQHTPRLLLFRHV